MPSVNLWIGDGAQPHARDKHLRTASDSLASRLSPRWRNGSRAEILRHAANAFPDVNRISCLVGKGALRTSPSSIGLSLSDSGSFCAVAVARGMPVGLDIEVIRPVNGSAALRDLGLVSAASQLDALAPGVRALAFFRIWTAFEAFLKYERADWDLGARSFQTLTRGLRLHVSGKVEFGMFCNQHLHFSHLKIDPRLVVCVATAKPAEVIAHNLCGS